MNEMHMYQAVIFDMDGTILDTLDDLTHSTNYILNKYHYPLRSRDEVRQFVGNGIYRLVERAVPEGTSLQQIDQLFDEFKEHYQLHCHENTRPYEGILELIKELKEADIKVAVVSNKAHEAVVSLSEEYFEGLFDASIGEREGIRRKPSPDSINEVLNKLNIDREYAIYVGDSEVDIETAKNANMECICVSWGFRDYEQLIDSGASIIVSNTDELEALILDR